MSHMHGQDQEPLQPLASAPAGAAKVPREESWQLLSLRAATIATTAETARPGAELWCSNSQSWALSLQQGKLKHKWRAEKQPYLD